MLMPSGKLLVFYGVNHVHKTNNARKLVELIKQNGNKAELVEYPNYSLAPSGFYIDQALRAKLKLREEELQIWFALNRFQYQPVLEKKLSEGTHVIAKDYIGTAIAWAMAKGVEKDWVEKLNSVVLKEDAAILLDSKLFLGGSAERTYGDYALIERVRRNLLELAKERGWIVIDSNRGEQDVFADVVKAAESLKIIS